MVDSVIGKSVRLGKDVIVHEKCIFGDNVQIQEKTEIPQETWLVSEKPSSGFSDDDDEEGLFVYFKNYSFFHRGAENLKKSRPKKLMKSNKSISRKNFFARIPSLLQFRKRPKINF